MVNIRVGKGVVGTVTGEVVKTPQGFEFGCDQGEYG